MFKSLYAWTIALAESRHAPLALALVSFAESSFFPIPPDVMLIPMAVAQPRRAWFFAAVCTVASVAGGCAGYLIGALLYDTLGLWLVNLYGAGARMDTLRESYATWGAVFILVKGLTPIPFKLVTIVSGLLGYNFLLFVLLSTVTRGARFFIVAGLLRQFGEPIKRWLADNFGLFLAALAAALVGGIVVATRLI